jgi:hypothetical protein
MLHIPRSSASWFGRRADCAQASHQPHRSSRRRLTLEPLEARALLSTWTVNSLGDAGIGSGQSGDLRYCITRANQTTGDNTIKFSVTGAITLNSALPDLSNTTGLMDVEGPGASSLTIARSGAPGTPVFRVFTIDGGAQVNLAGLTITGGSADRGGGIENDGTMLLDRCYVVGNAAATAGGGVANGGVMTIANSTISSNKAMPIQKGKGGVEYGGGIENDGTMSISNSTISGNFVAEVFDPFSGQDTFIAQGGGIYNAGTLSLTSSTVSNNGAYAYSGPARLLASGGGIENASTMTIAGCTISGNSVTSEDYSGKDVSGGAIETSGTLRLSTSTIDGNYATGGAGLIAGLEQPGGSAFGGGISVVSGSLVMTDDTVCGNRTKGGSVTSEANAYGFFFAMPAGSAFGGGIYIAGATAVISGTTISGNSSSGGDGVGIWETTPLPPEYFEGGDAGAGDGGGLYAAGSSLVLENDTIAGNSGVGRSGGQTSVPISAVVVDPSQVPAGATLWVVINDGQGGAGFGGLDLQGGAKLVNDTIADNSGAGGTGGGTQSIFTYYDPTTNEQEYYAVVTPDAQAASVGGLGAAGAVTLNNTIVARNSSDIGGGNVDPASASNLIGTGGSGGLIDGANGNKVGVSNPGLGTLANNGGPTQTIALVTGSPAIDAGSNALAVDPTTRQPLTTDQRGTGFPRIANGTVDIGAFEVQSYIGSVAVGWGTRSAALQTASDGLRLLPGSRRTDLPWLGINQVQISLDQAATLAAGDVSIIGASGIDYGVASVSGSGTSYTITLAHPINKADRVTIAIGNASIATFTRRLDVLPGDFNDDGVVNSQDMVGIRNEIIGYAGAVWTIFGDINGDGLVDMNDYTAVRNRIGTRL